MNLSRVPIIGFSFLIAFCGFVADPSRASAEETNQKSPPKLVLQITVDQLRGDLHRRYLKHMGPGGFRYLLENGVVYENAFHAHANTETIVGHATLATGAHPSAHGLVGNVWLDRASGEMMYNIEDARYPLLTAGADVDKATEIDPTQRAARTDGRSPAAMLTSTFSDELAIHTVRRAKIFGVSIKDRGAVSMAGHAGKAFWFSKATGQFVSSRFYYDRYPQWVTEFNETKPAQRYADKPWELLLERGKYQFADLDDMPWETELGEYGRVFPHPYGPGDGKLFTTLLTVSPAGEELIEKFFAPYVYLNREVIRERGLDPIAVEQAVAEELTKFKGAAPAVSSTVLLQGRVADTSLTRSILNSHNPRRSGDVYVVFEPHWFINDFEGLTAAATHGSPWRYDTYVPIIFAGASLEPRRVHRKVYTIDVASTLAAFIGAKPPSGASGEILQEVVE